MSLNDSEARLTYELAGMTRLHTLNALLLQAEDLNAILREILFAALELTRTDRGNIQLLSEDGRRLEIAVFTGHGKAFVDQFAYGGCTGTCEAAVRARERVIVEDVYREPILKGTADLDVLLGDGIRAVQSTPLISRAGHMVGMLSTHFDQPHRPPENVLRFVDLLARMAADFIEHNKAQEAARESEARFRRLVEQVKDYAIFMADPQGRPTSWNEGVRGVLGFEEAEFVGQDITRLIFTPEDLQRGVPQREMEEAAASGSANDDRWMRRKDGSRFWANGTTTVLRDAHGRTLGFTKVMRDQTERKQAEEAVRKAEDRFRTLVQNIYGYAIFMLNSDGYITEWTEGAERVKGYIAEEIIGKHVSIFYPPEAVAAGEVEREMQEAAATGRAERETWRVRKGGQRFWANEIATAIRDAAGNLVGFTKISCDLSERKQADEALRESEIRLRKVLDIETVGVLFFDGAGAIVNANDAFLQLVGYRREELEAGILSWQQLTPPEWLEVSRAQVSKLKEVGRIGPYEKQYFRKNGSRWWGLFAGAGLGDGITVEYVIDITEHKRAETALREREQQLSLVTETVPVSIIYVDAEQRVRFANQVYLNRVRKRADEVMGKTIRELLGESNYEKFSPYIAKAYQGEPQSYDIRFHYEALGMRDLHIRYAPATGSGGRVQGIVAAIEDITERKRAEEALREADRRKDEFLATLAHELRNPLAPLRNSLEILRVNDDDHKTVARIRATMEHQVSHLARLVDDLLEVSRITRGKIELRRQRVDLKTIIEGAVETVGPLADAKTQELTISCPRQPLYVDGDPLRLTQIVANLLNNAVKYTEEGGRIEVSAARQGSDAVVRVRDSGIGISPAVLPKIFDLFAQADTSSTRAQEGLGIGLTLVRHLLDLHGGSIEAKSSGLGRGSEFIVRLPLVAHDRADQPRALPAQAVGGGAARLPRKILVVDDNEAAADTLAELLGIYGHEVRVVHNGRAALDALADWWPDLMLLDIGMPGVDGYEVARRVREQAGSDEIKLIALTGWGQEKDLELARDAGFDHHLLKPLDLQALSEILKSLPTVEPKSR
jgi:PAS domain S-box-containing protein